MLGQISQVKGDDMSQVGFKPTIPKDCSAHALYHCATRIPQKSPNVLRTYLGIVGIFLLQIQTFQRGGRGGPGSPVDKPMPHEQTPKCQ